MAQEGNADFLISAVTGPEVVTGSTRMKAGTAQKMILNMISTGIMIKTGKTYGNLVSRWIAEDRIRIPTCWSLISLSADG